MEHSALFTYHEETGRFFADFGSDADSRRGKKNPDRRQSALLPKSAKNCQLTLVREGPPQRAYRKWSLVGEGPPQRAYRKWALVKEGPPQRAYRKWTIQTSQIAPFHGSLPAPVERRDLGGLEVVRMDEGCDTDTRGTTQLNSHSLRKFLVWSDLGGLERHGRFGTSDNNATVSF